MLAALRDEGLAVRQVGTWEKHNRNHMGRWGPVHGVMLHHTGPYRTQRGIINLCRKGRSELPGPLCMGVIDKRGDVHLIGYGRTNHAGLGDRDVLNAVKRERRLPRDTKADTDGNTHFYGFEIINAGDGRDPWPDDQIEGTVRASAALLRAHNWGGYGNTSVIAHKEWQPGKPDPAGKDFPGMDAIRSRVAQRLRHRASWSPR